MNINKEITKATPSVYVLNIELKIIFTQFLIKDLYNKEIFFFYLKKLIKNVYFEKNITIINQSIYSYGKQKKDSSSFSLVRMTYTLLIVVCQCRCSLSRRKEWEIYQYYLLILLFLLKNHQIKV
jgi:hypothetical protein